MQSLHSRRWRPNRSLAQLRSRNSVRHQERGNLGEDVRQIARIVCNEALTFLISLAICGQCLDIRTDYSPHATTLGLVSDFARSSPSLPQRLLQPLYRYG